MMIEISVACIAAAFVILVIFLIIGLVKSQKTLKEVNRTLASSKKELDEVSNESLKLIKNLNETTIDIKKKLHTLDFVFKPLSEVNEESEGGSRRHKNYDVVSEVVDCLATGLVLYNKIKGGIKGYVKTR
jgi:uncharacterized protein YoxC